MMASQSAFACGVRAVRAEQDALGVWSFAHAAMADRADPARCEP